MKLEPLPLSGAFVVQLERLTDERGFFARSCCEKEFGAAGLESRWAQCNISFSERRGTLRGMHFQRGAAAEVKLVRCTRGAAYDVIVDLRRSSATFCRWAAVELTAENRSAIYIPRGFAHGFLTLADKTELFYQMGNFYDGSAADGVRWNDPVFAIRWPDIEPILSARDAGYPDFSPSRSEP